MRLSSASAVPALLLSTLLIMSLPMDRTAAQSGTRRVQSGSGSRAYGSGTQPGSTTRRVKPSQTFEEKLWGYLTRQKYWNWAPVPGKSDGAYPGQSPHGMYLKMYLNRKAAGHPEELADGSIIIKENYAADGRTLEAITVMYRSKGYHPDAGDWYWVKYNPDGSVAKAPPEKGSVRLSGKPKGCIECHSGAAGDDYAFFNDSP